MASGRSVELAKLPRRTRAKIAEPDAGPVTRAQLDEKRAIVDRADREVLSPRRQREWAAAHDPLHVEARPAVRLLTRGVRGENRYRGIVTSHEREVWHCQHRHTASARALACAQWYIREMMPAG